MKNRIYEGQRRPVSQLPAHLFGKSAAPAPFTYDPPQEPITIVHEEAGFLLVSKPAGLLSVEGKPAEHKDCLERRIRQNYPTASLVHRLDLDTSGLVLIALNKATLRHLGLQFERRKTEKIYIATVWGSMEQNESQIDQPLICDWPNRPKQMINHEIGKQAITHWRVLERKQETTRLELRPLTGRSHQLRVHVAHIGHPILGDRLYGTEASRNAAERLMLHAESLSFHHPSDGRWIGFHDPCPF